MAQRWHIASFDVIPVTDIPPDILHIRIQPTEEDSGKAWRIHWQDIPIVQFKRDTHPERTAEALRRAGNRLQQLCAEWRIASLALLGESLSPSEWYALIEGMALGAYSHHLKRTRQPHPLQTIYLHGNTAAQLDGHRLSIETNIVWWVRDLINDPPNQLNAQTLANAIAQAAQSDGFQIEIWGRQEIEQARMAGILAVNRGSVVPPAFVIAEYKPDNPINRQPIVLIGKGVIFDTGGINLKASPEAMINMMKCDMGGAAVVAGVLRIACQRQLPLHLIGLIPAVENRISASAILPSEVIEYADGTTVEVANTDAEGRLILADALLYAKRYQPELTITVATLTGAALRALGPYGSVAFGKDVPPTMMETLRQAGEETYERIVEFPLWDEYREELESPVADLKNVSDGRLAGAQIAAQFLAHFARSYPWIHLDIAPVGFLLKPWHYHPAGGTGIPVRMLIRFLEKQYLAAKQDASDHAG